MLFIGQSSQNICIMILAAHIPYYTNLADATLNSQTTDLSNHDDSETSAFITIFTYPCLSKLLFIRKSLERKEINKKFLIL